MNVDPHGEADGQKPHMTRGRGGDSSAEGEGGGGRRRTLRENTETATDGRRKAQQLRQRRAARRATKEIERSEKTEREHGSDAGKRQGWEGSDARGEVVWCARAME